MEIVLSDINNISTTHELRASIRTVVQQLHQSGQLPSEVHEHMSQALDRFSSESELESLRDSGERLVGSPTKLCFHLYADPSAGGSHNKYQPSRFVCWTAVCHGQVPSVSSDSSNEQEPEAPWIEKMYLAFDREGTLTPGKLTKLLTLADPAIVDPVNADIDGTSPLCEAVNTNNPAVASFLLDHGATIEQATRKYTPLFIAAEGGHYEAVRALLWRSCSLRGEFTFNNETPLSIAAFKLVVSVAAEIQGRLMHGLPSEIGEAYNNVREQAASIARRGGDWRAYGDDLHRLTFGRGREAAMVARACLALPNFVAHLKPSSELKARLDVYTLLHDNTLLVHPEDEYQRLLSDDEYRAAGPLAQDYFAHLLPGRITPAVKQSKAAMQSIVTQLSAELKASSEVDRAGVLVRHPKLFIAQWRGVHGYRKHFPTELQFEDWVRSSHLNRIAPAPAVYRMCQVNVGGDSQLRESEGKAKAHQLKGIVSAASPSSQFDLQKHMSKDYAGFLASINNDAEGTYLDLCNASAVGYPHFAASDLPYHALRYAGGLKPVESLVESRRWPEYTSTGKPSHPILGKIFIGLFSLQQYDQHRFVHVSTSLGYEHLGRYIAPERETSITGAVQDGRLFFEGIVWAPDFSRAHSATLQKEFGFTEAQWQRHAAMAKKKLDVTNKADVKEFDAMFAKVFEHQQQHLLLAAQDRAIACGGHLIFAHDKNTFALEPMQLDPKSGDIFARERKLMDTVGVERFRSESAAEAMEK